MVLVANALTKKLNWGEDPTDRLTLSRRCGEERGERGERGVRGKRERARKEEGNWGDREAGHAGGRYIEQITYLIFL